LSRFFDKESNQVNWSDLARAVEVAVRLQDNIIDYTQYFLKENEETQKKERRVGIGSLGLGTLMIQLGLRYGSDGGNEFVDDLYKFIAYHAYSASMDIAQEKGSFPAYEYDKFIQSGFMKRLLKEFPELDDKLQTHGIRNVTILTQAPTGSTGTYIDNIPMFRKEFGGTTTGIEPYFSWEYWRAGRLGVTKQTVDLAKEYMGKNGLKDIKELPDFFVTAMDLEPSDHVKVQAAVQKWTDSSISKTANCPSDYTIEQTDDLYMLSYDLGLKGMTIYRDGSRQAQVLSTKEEDAKLESHIEAKKMKDLKESKLSTELNKEVNPFNIQKRPKRLYGFTEKISFTYGDHFARAYVTINLYEGEPWEVFISTKVKEVSSLAKALGLMTTKLLRLGGTSDNLQQAIDTLTYDQTMGTLPSAVANILKQIQKEQLSIEAASNPNKEVKLAKCPHCGEEAYDKGNCICFACGTSKCN
jgi:ribonucleoside-diphosphate reductase alpha chain